jgi:hypothetical protein
MCKAGDHMNGWLMGQSGLQVDDWIGSMPCREGAGAWPAVPHLRSSRSTLSIGGMASTVLPATLMGGDDGDHPWRVDAGCSTVQVKLRCSSLCTVLFVPGARAGIIHWPGD